MSKEFQNLRRRGQELATELEKHDSKRAEIYAELMKVELEMKALIYEGDGVDTIDRRQNGDDRRKDSRRKNPD